VIEFFGPLFFIVNMSGLLVLIFRERVERMIPLAFIFSALMLFPFGFLWQLTFGVYLLAGVSFIFPVWLLAEKICRKKADVKCKELFFTSGLVMFLMIYSAVYFLNIRRDLNSWDEFSFWGPKIKEMLRLDTYYSVREAAPHSHQDYPPAMQLIEFLWCRLSGGIYRERSIYRALQTFLLSLYLPVFEKMNMQKGKHIQAVIRMIFASFVVMLCPLVMDSYLIFYNQIGVDYALALLMAYMIVNIVITEKYTVAFFIQLSAAMTFLILTKQMGLPLYLLSAGILLSFVLWREKDVFRVKIKMTFAAAAACVIPLGFSGIWNWYISDKELWQQFKISDIHIFSFISIIRGTGGEPYQHESCVNFLDKLLTRSIADRPFPMSYWQTAFLLAGILMFLYVCRLYKENEILILNLLLSAGAVAYAFAMLLLYVYSFGAREGPATASYERYMGTYLAGWAAIAVMLVIYGILKSGKYRLSMLAVYVLICSAGIISGTSIKTIGYGFSGNGQQDDCRMAENIILQHTPETAKVLFVSQANNGFNYVRLRYLCLPRTSAGISLTDMTLEDARMEFKKYDYIYLHVIDEPFKETYRTLFDSEHLSEGQLYQTVDGRIWKLAAGGD
jgi:hypothetical protein